MSLFLVHKLFAIVMPKLLELRWFAQFWRWLVTMRTGMLNRLQISKSGTLSENRSHPAMEREL